MERLEARMLPSVEGAHNPKVLCLLPVSMAGYLGECVLRGVVPCQVAGASMHISVAPLPRIIREQPQRLLRCPQKAGPAGATYPEHQAPHVR